VDSDPSGHSTQQRQITVIAILYALGVEAGAILVLLIGLLVFKRYKTIKHPAVFKTRVRLTEGEFPGVKDTWKKCYGEVK
jgi:hypothetical protein